MTPRTRLYLASASPRRRLLVQTIGLPVTVGLSPVDEAALEAAYSGPSGDLGEYLARRKAASAARALGEAPAGQTARDDDVLDDDVLVVGADTTVILDDRVLGKPVDPTEAITMLRGLRGLQHTVVTGVAVARPPAPDRPLDLRSARVATRVTMRPYSDEEIAAYVATGDPMDKAGAYAVQHGAFKPVASIEGCYTAVVGLPLCALAALVAEMTGTVPPPRTAHPGYPDGTHYDAPAGPHDITRCPWSDRCRAPLPVFARDQAR